MQLMMTHTALRGDNVRALLLSDLFVKDILNPSAGKEVKVMVSFYSIFYPPQIHLFYLAYLFFSVSPNLIRQCETQSVWKS